MNKSTSSFMGLALLFTSLLFSSCSPEVRPSNKLEGKWRVTHIYQGDNSPNLIGSRLNYQEYEFIPSDDTRGEIIRSTVDSLGNTKVATGIYLSAREFASDNGISIRLLIEFEGEELQEVPAVYIKDSGTPAFNEYRPSDELWLFFAAEMPLLDVTAFKIRE